MGLENDGPVIMIKKLLLLTVCLLLIAQAGYAATQITRPQALYPFVSPQKRQQFQTLTEQLRCLVCQNESLADSNATLAKQFRADIYKMIKAGKTNAEIKSYFVKRYGDFVLFKPPLNILTYVLWFGPMILLLLAFVVLFVIILRQRKAKQLRLSDDEQHRLDQLLKEGEQ